MVLPAWHGVRPCRSPTTIDRDVHRSQGAGVVQTSAGGVRGVPTFERQRHGALRFPFRLGEWRRGSLRALGRLRHYCGAALFSSGCGARHPGRDGGAWLCSHAAHGYRPEREVRGIRCKGEASEVGAHGSQIGRPFTHDNVALGRPGTALYSCTYRACSIHLGSSRSS